RLAASHTLFPYTTLFRSGDDLAVLRVAGRGTGGDDLRPGVRVVRTGRGDLAAGRRPGVVVEPGGDENRTGIRTRAELRPHGHRRSEEHTSELQSRENLVC